MRMSRRFSVMGKKKGVAWRKYSCTQSTYQSYYLSSSTYQATANYDSLDAYTGYSFNSANGVISNAGSLISSTASNPYSGVLYFTDGSVLWFFNYLGIIGSQVKYSSYYQTPQSETTYTYARGGTDYGVVYADEGAYPDATTGYVYVTTFSNGGVTYTVMRNGSTYYCYALV